MIFEANMAPSWAPKSSPNKSKNRCLPRSIFDGIWVDSGKENGGKLASKSCQKSMLTSNGRFSRKPVKTNGFSMIFVDLGRQVGIENLSKIDINMKSTSEGILASIFLNVCGFWEATWRRNSFQNRCKNASKKRCKFRCVLDVSWVGPGGVRQRAGHGPAPILGPPN